MTYAEKLKDPRWQKKRLEIMERDEFTCQNCGTKNDCLHIHHKTYEFGNDPWNYEDKNFITLCEVCHKQEELNKIYLNHTIKYLLKNGYTNIDILDLLTETFMEVYKANEQKEQKNG